MRGSYFCHKISRPNVRGAAGKINSMRHFNYPIGNRLRDLPGFSTVPRPTAPTRNPNFHILHLVILFLLFPYAARLWLFSKPKHAADYLNGILLCLTEVYWSVIIFLGHAVAQLVEALRYNPAGCGFDSRWCH
jgi:hypothetical protein